MVRHESAMLKKSLKRLIYLKPRPPRRLPDQARLTPNSRPSPTNIGQARPSPADKEMFKGNFDIFNAFLVFLTANEQKLYAILFIAV